MWNTLIIGNWLKYTYAKTYQNRLRFDKVITEMIVCSLLPRIGVVELVEERTVTGGRAVTTALHRGATTAEKLRGGQGLGPNTGAQAPRARPKAELGVGCGRGSPPPAVRVRGIIPGKFLKTQMLNPAFWSLLAVNFFAFWKLRPRSWVDQYIVGPPT